MKTGENSIELLAVDANALLQAAVGGRSLLIFRKLENITSFHTSVSTYEEVLEYLPYLSAKQNVLLQDTLSTLYHLPLHVHAPNFYKETYLEAWDKLHKIDADDVPLLALALKLNCPIWTNNIKHFKGAGVQLYNTADLLKMGGLA